MENVPLGALVPDRSGKILCWFVIIIFLGSIVKVDFNLNWFFPLLTLFFIGLKIQYDYEVRQEWLKYGPSIKGNMVLEAKEEAIITVIFLISLGLSIVFNWPLIQSIIHQFFPDSVVG